MRFILFLLLFVTTPSFAQLSDKWEGKFSGDLIATNLDNKVSDFHMELYVELQSDYTYKWTIIYGQDSTRQERKYILKPDGNNHFILDEQNGIELHMSHSENCITSVFEVQGNLLHVKYTLGKKGVLYELTSSNAKKTTGGGKDENANDIPEVHSYKTTAFQSAFLKRMK
jgi:hypothetical protein